MDGCAYCKKERYNHGGQCSGRYLKDRSCLAYERDERGKWIRDKSTWHLGFEEEIPKPGDVKEVMVCGVDKTIEICNIRWVEWDKNARGLRGIILYVEFGYWSEENGVITEKPVLKIVK